MSMIQVRYSDDGGENWSNWRDVEAGDTGDFLKPVVIRRLGMTRQRVWEFMDTSATPRDLMAASIILESE